jgi:acid phosphatase type 7
VLVESRAAPSDPVIAAAGDIACDPADSSFNGGNGTSDSCRAKYTSDMLVNGGFAAVLPLGDNQYYCGGYQGFAQSYDISWGRVKSITHPAVGNHEYLTSGGTNCDTTGEASGYFQYFGAAAGSPSQGYYSYDVGSWHLIALNTNCGSAGGCSASSAQGKWLSADLAAHGNMCTLAYWHIPLYSSGGRANANSASFWQALYAANADLVLTGHDHTYERFAPQDPYGKLDSVRGIREFVVGTGGANHTSFTTIAANSQVRNSTTFGIFKVTLHPTSYDWQFVPEPGGTFTDSGTTMCHGASSDIYGGGSKGAPDAAASSAGTERVVIRGLDDAGWLLDVSGGTSSGWRSLGGGTNADPGSAARTPTRDDVYIRGFDNALWHTSVTGGVQAGWGSIGGGLGSGPDAAIRAQYIDIFVAGTDGSLYHIYSPDGGNTYGGWDALGGGMSSDPGAVGWGGNRVDVFIRGLDLHLWHKAWTGTAWSGWEDQGGILGSGPDAASCSFGHLDVFALGSDGTLYRKGWNGAVWSGWAVVVAGAWSAGPGAVCRPGTGLVDVYERAADGSVQLAASVPAF